MSMWPREDRQLLIDMLEHAQEARAAAQRRSFEELERDAILRAALERFLEIVGEAASKLSEGTRRQLAGVPWREIVGMRNRLIHGYGDVDREVVWKTVTQDLPVLIERLEAALGR